jgi:hypothetical protein
MAGAHRSRRTNNYIFPSQTHSFCPTCNGRLHLLLPKVVARAIALTGMVNHNSPHHHQGSSPRPSEQPSLQPADLTAPVTSPARVGSTRRVDHTSTVFVCLFVHLDRLPHWIHPFDRLIYCCPTRSVAFHTCWGI